MLAAEEFKRRDFIRTGAIATLGMAILPSLNAMASTLKDIKIGIIGLDTSHSVAFTKLLNARPALSGHEGVKVIAAFPARGSNIESNINRLPGFVAEIKNLGVQIVDSMEELLQQSDVILLESNDGRMRCEQVLQVLQSGKPMFMDKPVASSLRDVIRIYKAAESYKVPVYSTSLLRYIVNFSEIEKQGKIQGAFTYSPAMIEETHPDLFWYGIHGIEMVYKIMGTGCKSVSRISTPDTDIVTGIWENGRIGTFRGIRKGSKDFGGTVFTEKQIIEIVAPNDYGPLISEIVNFFKTGVVPVQPTETIEIYAFMEAADESKRQGGKSINLADIVAAAVN